LSRKIRTTAGYSNVLTAASWRHLANSRPRDRLTDAHATGLSIANGHISRFRCSQKCVLGHGSGPDASSKLKVLLAPPSWTTGARSIAVKDRGYRSDGKAGKGNEGKGKERDPSFRAPLTGAQLLLPA